MSVRHQHSDSQTLEDSILDDALEAASPATDTATFVGPTPTDLHLLAARYGRVDTRPDVAHLNVLTDPETFEAAVENQLVGLGLKDGVEDDVLSVRTLEQAAGPNSPELASSLVITDEHVAALVRPGVITETGSEVVADAQRKYESIYDAAEIRESFGRMPALSTVISKADEWFSAAFVEDLQAVLEAAHSLGRRGDAIGIEDVLISLAAKHEVTQYDVGRFCEDANVLSTAKISRTKQFYEDVGAVGVRKVPQDVGRPKNGLTVEASALQSGDADLLLSRLKEIREDRGV